MKNINIELIQNQENRIFDQSFIFIFNYVNKIIPNYFGKNDFKLFNEFIRLQSLFAKFLIKKKEIFIRKRNYL